MRLKTINSILSKIGLLLVVEIDFNKKGFIKLFIVTKKTFKKINILPVEEYFYKE